MRGLPDLAASILVSSIGQHSWAWLRWGPQSASHISCLHLVPCCFMNDIDLGIAAKAARHGHGVGAARRRSCSYALRSSRSGARRTSGARAIYRYALDHIPRAQADAVYQRFVAFEKQHGDREGIEV